MTSDEKPTAISPWIAPEERVRVQLLDARDLNTGVTGCTEQLVDFSIEPLVSHMKPRLSIPLRQVELTEDFSHYAYR